MTTRYQGLYDATDNKRFKLTSKLGLMLVYQTYVPDQFHTEINPEHIFVDIPQSMTFKQFTSNGMSWIMDHLTGNAKTHIKKNRDKVKENAQKFPNREVLEQLGDLDEVDLKGTGIKYLVVYWDEGLLFCEQLMEYREDE